MTFNTFADRLANAINADDRCKAVVKGGGYEQSNAVVTVSRIVKRRPQHVAHVVVRSNGADVTTLEDIIITAPRQAGYIRDMCLSALR